jgi:hypothetical protein
MGQNKKDLGFTLIESLICLVAIFIVVFVGYRAWHQTHPSDGSASTAQSSADTHTEQDLQKLTSSILAYGNKNATLPNNLSQLKLTDLNHSLDQFSYKSLMANDSSYFGQGNNAAKDFTGFTLCASFSSAGKPFADDEPSTYPGIFQYHRKGDQCYEYDFERYGGTGEATMRPVLINGEKNLPATVKTSALDLAAYANNLSQEFTSQAKALSLQLSNEKTNKQCSAVDRRTSSNQGVYRCKLTIDASAISPIDRNSRYDALVNFQKMNQEQGYKNTVIFSGCTTSSLSCDYSSLTKDEYCDLAAGYSFALNPPNDTASLQIICYNLPYVTAVPAGFAVNN